jgi:hypothetical protein
MSISQVSVSGLANALTTVIWHCLEGELGGDVLTVRALAAHWQTWSAVGALLICFAIVFNVSPFGKASKWDADRPSMDQPVAMIAISEPQIKMDTSVARLDVGAMRPEFQPFKPKQREVEVEPRRTAQDLPAPDPATEPRAPVAGIAGVWAPQAAECSARDFRDGLLPTIINVDGAWAGETRCSFTDHRQVDTGLDVLAKCSNSREHWTIRVRLSLKHDRLIWTSKRGTQIYTRCPPDFLISAAR